MKLAIKMTLAIVATVIYIYIVRLYESPERKYMRCYNRTKSLELCVPTYMERVSK